MPRYNYQLVVKTFVSTKALLLDEKVNAFLESLPPEANPDVRPFCCYGGSMMVGMVITYYENHILEEDDADPE